MKGTKPTWLGAMGKSPIKEMGDNWNSMNFGNTRNGDCSFWDVAFPHSIHNHTHNMSEVNCANLEKLSFMSSVKGSHAEVNQLTVILCAFEDRGKYLLNEKRTLEKEKACLAIEAKNPRKQVSYIEADWLVLDEANVNLDKDKKLLVEKEKEILNRLESVKKKK